MNYRISQDYTYYSLTSDKRRQQKDIVLIAFVIIRKSKQRMLSSVYLSSMLVENYRSAFISACREWATERKIL
jgi:hypothetical protein